MCLFIGLTRANYREFIAHLSAMLSCEVTSMPQLFSNSKTTEADYEFIIAFGNQITTCKITSIDEPSGPRTSSPHRTKRSRCRGEIQG
jgi:hypothetical protein